MAEWGAGFPGVVLPALLGSLGPAPVRLGGGVTLGVPGHGLDGEAQGTKYLPFKTDTISWAARAAARRRSGGACKQAQPNLN
ncbi:hypothetical protein NDU88_002361 [Pleurodeles waltl]|uniref:Uncharacterized protein n=1 Tax=Pleurodeles waltl TaxID=8319 RepID=A0AAV7Q9N4_PLEWA|nr:hypothetical protein NDU88_002361 [Pleurodeles waltl]